MSYACLIAMVSKRTTPTSCYVIFSGLLVISSKFILRIDASCNEEHRQACRSSAVEGRLDLLASGGQCSARQYVQFTHICTVTNFLPGVGSCCCVHQNIVLCCRYHQDWHLFRCVETEDSVDNIQDESKSSSSQLEVIVPVVSLVGLLLIFVTLCSVCRFFFCRSRSRRRELTSAGCCNPCWCCCCCGPSESDKLLMTHGRLSEDNSSSVIQHVVVTPSNSSALRRLDPHGQGPDSRRCANGRERILLAPIVVRANVGSDGGLQPSAPTLSDLAATSSPDGHLANNVDIIACQHGHLANEGDIIGCRHSHLANNVDIIGCQHGHLANGGDIIRCRHSHLTNNVDIVECRRSHLANGGDISPQQRLSGTSSTGLVDRPTVMVRSTAGSSRYELRRTTHARDYYEEEADDFRCAGSGVPSRVTDRPGGNCELPPPTYEETVGRTVDISRQKNLTRNS